MTNCGICRTNEGTNTLPDTFTDTDYLTTKAFCDGCIPLFDTQWLKTSFYWTRQEKKKIKQQEFYDILHKLEFPCLLSFTVSRKKHRLFRSKWSLSNKEVYISTDTEDVVLNLDKALPVLDYLQRFYRENKVSKDWIINEFPTNAIKKIGFEKYIQLQKKIKKIKGTPTLDLFVKFINL